VTGATIDRDAILRDFTAAVNMTPADLERWLATKESHAVGYKGRDGDAAESIGHASGRRIVAILRTRRPELSDDDYAHMRRVIGYIRRHTAQGGPARDREHSRWRYSLMNWGHDPIRG